MNAHQRRKESRRLSRSAGGSTPHRFIRHWADLAAVPASETHYLEIHTDDGYGYIKRKDGLRFWRGYLSTHTFYGSSYMRSTQLLRECGFNVTLANWDALEPCTNSA